MRFLYHTEPIRAALIVVAVLVIAGIVLPSTLLRVLLFSSAGGAALWLVFQVVRKNRGVTLEPDALVIEDAHRGIMQRFEYAAIQGCALTKQDGLVIAYRPIARQSATTASGVPSLAAARPEPTFTRLVVTPALDNALILLHHLSAQMPAPSPLDSESVLRMANHRRTRRRVIALFLILAIPLYMYITMRGLALFRAS
ncbi:MAG: hypothetical protein KF716_31245 [Anaerolineae bacterium]|nr:hypothetical protein [Anaerolineae bacterium]